MEQLQPRGELPPIPDLDPTPDLDIDSRQLTSAAEQLAEAGRQAAQAEIKETVDELREVAGLPEHFDAGAAVDGAEAFLRRWRSGDKTPDP